MFSILSPSEPILRAIIENRISSDYVLCYIPRAMAIMSYNFQSRKQILTLRGVYRSIFWSSDHWWFLNSPSPHVTVNQARGGGDSVLGVRLHNTAGKGLERVKYLFSRSICQKYISSCRLCWMTLFIKIAIFGKYRLCNNFNPYHRERVHKKYRKNYNFCY